MKKNEYEYNDIVYALRNVGLEKGDSVFIHSNLGFFGKMKDATVSDDYNNFFKNAIFEIIGENGTLITPTFHFHFVIQKNLMWSKLQECVECFLNLYVKITCL